MKMSLFLFLWLTSVNSLVSAQQTWHVSGTGSDGNDGKTSATALRSLQKAAAIVRPGDIVLIGNGIYSSADRSGGGAVLNITTSGTKDAWITWKAENGQHPDIHPAGWAGIQVTASYQIIEGISVTGANDSIVLLKAQQDAKNPNADPHFNTNGIFINGRTKKPAEKPHHVIIRNCTVGKCPGGGITAIETDYITIENCVVFENAWYMRFGGSGISTLNNWAYDNAPGYHNIIQRNFCWNNKTMVAWEKIGRLSDGNGIILDVTDQEINGATNMNADKVIKPGDTATIAAKPKRPEWKGRSLVANNVCAFNGGSGIHTFRTKYVDVINNTTYHNGGIVGYPEMFANSSEDVVFLNNIISPRPGGMVTANNKNINIKWDYNLSSVMQPFFQSPHGIIADPLFVNACFDRLTADFHVKPASPAIHSGAVQYDSLSVVDVMGNPAKKKITKINRGAYAF